MRLLGRMEIASGCCHVANHIPGVENRLADGIFRWPDKEIQQNATQRTQQQGWIRQETAGGELVLDTIYTLDPLKERLDDHKWSLLTNQIAQKGQFEKMVKPRTNALAEKITTKERRRRQLTRVNFYREKQTDRLDKVIRASKKNSMVLRYQLARTQDCCKSPRNRRTNTKPPHGRGKIDRDPFSEL